MIFNILCFILLAFPVSAQDTLPDSTNITALSSRVVIVNEEIRDNQSNFWGVQVILTIISIMVGILTLVLAFAAVMGYVDRAALRKEYVEEVEKQKKYFKDALESIIDEKHVTEAEETDRFIKKMDSKNRAISASMDKIKKDLSLVSSSWKQKYEESKKVSIAGLSDSNVIIPKKEMTKKEKDSRILYQKGFSMWANQKYEEALSLFSNSLSLNPAFAGAYQARAMVYNILSKKKESFSDLRMAASLSPHNPMYLYNVATARLDQLEEISDTQALNELEQAFQEFEQAAKSDSKNDSLFLNWGVAFNQYARITKETVYAYRAIGKYKEASLLAPKRQMPVINIALSHILIGDILVAPDKKLHEYMQAISYFEKAEALKELDIESVNTLLSTLIKASYLDEANQGEILSQAQEKAIQTNIREEGSTNYNLACIYALLGNNDLAFGLIEVLLEDKKYNIQSIRDENDFTQLHEDPKWEHLLREKQKKGVKLMKE